MDIYIESDPVDCLDWFIHDPECSCWYFPDRQLLATTIADILEEHAQGRPLHVAQPPMTACLHELGDRIWGDA